MKDTNTKSGCGCLLAVFGIIVAVGLIWNLAVTGSFVPSAEQRAQHPTYGPEGQACAAADVAVAQERHVTSSELRDAECHVIQQHADGGSVVLTFVNEPRAEGDVIGLVTRYRTEIERDPTTGAMRATKVEAYMTDIAH